MAVKDRVTGLWLNKDGLPVIFGTGEVTPTKTGELNLAGDMMHVTEIDLDWTDLPTFGNSIILNEDAVIPANAWINKVVLDVETAFVGATATFSLGGIQSDRATTTNLGTGIFINALAVTSMGAGNTTFFDGTPTGYGTSIGTQIASGALLTATVGTASFSAGHAKIRIFWYL